ncbi:hypothetical protein BHM03_00044642, partial [Ensete ventricosum]
LETTLRNFSCLTTGDSIMVAYNNKKYYIDIVETKPSSAISIIETDCEVDFAPPLDYKEPERPQTSLTRSNAPEQGFFQCFPLFLFVSPKEANEQPEKKEEPKFQAFTGKKYSLKG